jgi:threonine dehydrogenase-like Zn-dependent dehydrogenase
MYKWHLYGSGLDNLHLEEADVPTPGADELLIRQDACGLCFSDTKVIGLGENHPRMVGRDMKANPVTLGHEVACTVVKVGDALADRFEVGQRFIVQADVFYQGVSMAYGYAISGGLAEYSIIPKSMIEGDEGCYLLPVKPESGYVETALVEPWACVVAAYNQSHRDAIKPGGRLLVIAGDDSDAADWSGAIDTANAPATVALHGNTDTLEEDFGQLVVGHGGLEVIHDSPDWALLKQELTAGEGFDDIVILGAVAPEIVENASTLLANHGIVNLVGGHQFPRKLSLDIGRIHYNWHHYVGTASWRVADGYAEQRSAELVPGGTSWFIGAGGPMGQMHVQLAIESENPPKLVVATDVDAERLKSVVDRLSPEAESRGIKLVALNPKEMSPEAFNEELRTLTDGRGYDDVVSMVPVAALIEHSADFVADGGWLNIFAGVARGTMATLDVNAIAARRVRYLGSSGSSIADMRRTLEMVEAGQLSTNTSLAAIGGMKVAREGIAAVKEGRFAGKTLVFPLIPDLPLITLPELKDSYPTVYEKLKDGQYWTKEAEVEFLALNSK